MSAAIENKSKSENQANKILESPQGSTDDSETLCSKCAKPFQAGQGESSEAAQIRILRERLHRARQMIKKIPIELFQTKEGFEKFIHLIQDVGKQFKLDLLIKNDKIMIEQFVSYFSNLEKDNKKIKDQIDLKFKKEIQQLNEKVEQISKELENSKNQVQLAKQPILDELPKALFIGQTGTTELLHRLTDQSNFKEFELVPSKDGLFHLVDAPSFDFEDIDVRETQITQYQEFFDKYSVTLRTIFLVVNFERTDLMKKKLTDIYKFFRKFGYMMSIIVTDFDLSESKEEDMKHLQERFKIFKIQQIIFVTKEEDSLKEIGQAIPLFFDVKDTIFEKPDEEDQLKLITQIANRISR